MDHSKRRPRADFVLNQQRYAGAADPARARELRLRVESRACAVGAARVRLPRDHRAFVRRHLLQQLLQERAAPDRAAGAKRRGVVSRGRGHSQVIDCGSICPNSGSRRPTGARSAFAIDPSRKHSLVHGLDEIGQTLEARGSDPGVRGDPSRALSLVVRVAARRSTDLLARSARDERGPLRYFTFD